MLKQDVRENVNPCKGTSSIRGLEGKEHGAFGELPVLWSQNRAGEDFLRVAQRDLVSHSVEDEDC